MYIRHIARWMRTAADWPMAWRSGLGRGSPRGNDEVLHRLLSLVLALFKLGAVPVHIDSGMDLENAGRCVAEAEPDAFFG